MVCFWVCRGQEGLQGLDAVHKLKQQFRFEEAREVLAVSLAVDPLNEVLLSELADCCFQQGDNAEAKKYYDILAQMRPGNKAYIFRSMVLSFKLQEYPECVSLGSEALMRDTIPALSVLVGDAWQKLERSDSAAAWYARVLEKYPQNRTALMKYAAILIGRQDYDTAARRVRSYLADYPRDVQMNAIGAKISFLKGEHLRSRDEFLFLRDSLCDNSYHTHLYLGLSYVELGSHKRAEAPLLAAWQIDSSDVNLALAIAGVMANEYKDPEPARQWFSKAESMLEPDRQMLYKIYKNEGHMFYARNMWKMGADYLIKAYELNPKDVSAAGLAAYCLQLAGDLKQAGKWYETVLDRCDREAPDYIFAKKRLTEIQAELFMMSQ